MNGIKEDMKHRKVAGLIRNPSYKAKRIYGSADFENRTPLLKDVHKKVVTPWWNSYKYFIEDVRRQENNEYFKRIER